MAESHEQQASAFAEPATRYFPGEQKEPEQAYAALSITALIGFGIGTLYAIIVVPMAVIAFFSGKPLLFTGWSILVPMLAVLLCMIALVRIRRSEGTLAGRALARWGLMLSLFVGLCYHAYIAAVYFAVRQQARQSAEAWLDRLSNRDITSAAIAVLPPVQQGGVEQLEDESERIHQLNLLLSEGGGGPRNPMPVNMMERFRQHKLVRLLFQAGPDEVQLLSKGVKSWSYTKAGYEVSFTYAITTPDGEFEAVVTLLGSEAPDNEYPGRKWQVVMHKTNLNEQDASLHPTRTGQAFMQLAREGQVFLGAWQENMAPGTRAESFLMTLPEEEREQVRKDLHRVRRLGAVGGSLTTALPTTEKAVERYHRFLDGSLVEIDLRHFLADKETREKVAAKIRKMFSATVREMEIKPSDSTPLRSRAGEKLVVAYDMRMSDSATVMAEAVFEVECDARALESADAKAHWRVARIRLVGGGWNEATSDPRRMKDPRNPQRRPVP
jgi:hypothetical protein